MPNWPIVLLLVLQQWPAADAKLVKLTIDLVTRDSNGPSKSSSWMYGPSCNSSEREVIPCPSLDDTQIFGVRM